MATKPKTDWNALTDSLLAVLTRSGERQRGIVAENRMNDAKQQRERLLAQRSPSLKGAVVKKMVKKPVPQKV